MSLYSWNILVIISSVLCCCAASSAVSPTSVYGKICGSFDIRNSPSNLEELRNCTVIEGFLQIVLMHNATESDFRNLHFPELTQITGYLLIYRVKGITSVGSLFPNLAVIRGKELFENYALVIYETFDLLEVGLRSLTHILRGGVRINKNEKLCYVNTVNWEAIAVSNMAHNLQDNKKVDECPRCQEAVCEHGLCWGEGEHSCQEQEESIFARCHQQCIGGCNKTDPNKCTACRNVEVNGVCQSSCPPGMIEYLGWRCIREEDCRALKEYDVSKKQTGADIQDTMCDPCKVGSCERVCIGAAINSISDAQRMKGCTIINGSLEIKIMDGNDVFQELETYLADIKEITGYLKVSRCLSIYSLSFLRQLWMIHGKELDQKKYVLSVFENDNLQELWQWDKRPQNEFHIKNGRLFFQGNRKLCHSHIDRLQELTGLSPRYTDLEVSPKSNGDMVACKVMNLTVKVTVRHSESVVISWDPCDVPDFKSVLGFIIYYRVAPIRNIKLYNDTERCVGPMWRIKDSTIHSHDDYNCSFIDISKQQHYSVILTKLDPFTQYAFYVMTYTARSTGFKSPVQYFVTLPDRPSMPINLKASATESSSQLQLKWQRPEKPNGVLSYYIISGVWQKDNQDILDGRNYCENVLNQDQNEKYYTTTTTSEETPKAAEDLEECNLQDCKCGQTIEIDYEAKCSKNDVIWDRECARFVYNRLLLSASSILNTQGPENTTNDTVEEKLFKYTPQPSHMWGDSSLRNNRTKPNRDGYLERFWVKVAANESSAVVSGLAHYALYSVQLVACREQYIPDETTTEMDSKACSFIALSSHRTGPSPTADLVQNILVTVTNRTVRLDWKEPHKTNGIIVAYRVETKRTDKENILPIIECITRREHVTGGYGHLIPNLLPGIYEFRVRAISLAGEANFSSAVTCEIEDASTDATTATVIGSSLGVSLILLAAAFFALFLQKMSTRRTCPSHLIATVNPDYVSGGYTEDEWEVPRESVLLRSQLGKGTFGTVWAGQLDGSRHCAVKMVGESATVREVVEFLNEASVMKQFAGASHVVRLLGVVSKGKPPMVVMELMEKGDLKSFLRSLRIDDSGSKTEDPFLMHEGTLQLERLLKMSAEVADGMAYLEARKFVHRDLAARNCMVTRDLIVKVGDFGMTRDVYENDYYRKGSKGLLPVRWMAPESLADGVFSSQSDVWSYGIVLWEMATLAEQPYQGLANEQVLPYVLGGEVLERPCSCPDIMYSLMLRCWLRRPSHRPSFTDLLATIGSYLLGGFWQDFQERSFYHSPEMQEVREGDRKDAVSLLCPSAVAYWERKGAQSDTEEELLLQGHDIKVLPNGSANGYVLPS